MVPPTWQLPGGSAVALVTEPGWIATLWLGLWAKLGWFNVHLPTPTYLWFLVPSGAILAGGWQAWRTRSVTALASAAGLGAAGVLLLVYMVHSDWQPQGRLLLPAVGPACVLAVLGAEWMCGRISPGSRLSPVLILATALGRSAACLMGLYALRLAYGPA